MTEAEIAALKAYLEERVAHLERMEQKLDVFAAGAIPQSVDREVRLMRPSLDVLASTMRGVERSVSGLHEGFQNLLSEMLRSFREFDRRLTDIERRLAAMEKPPA
jgi:hypothetical protein